MAYFEWASDMAIDNNGPIDQDHRKLVDLVNELHTATRQGRGGQVVGMLLQRLIADTIEHLRHEEQEMERVRFPDLVEHKKHHALFVERLYQLQGKYQGGSITVASELSMVLRDWLSLHIRRDDRELRDFLQVKKKPAIAKSRSLA